MAESQIVNLLAVDSPASNPGAVAARAPRSEGWLSVVYDLIAGEPNSVRAVAVSFLKAPVATILRLAHDATYTGYWNFMLACMGAQLTLLYVLLPRLGAFLFHTPAVNRAAESLTVQGLQLLGFPILTMIQYYFCQWIGTIRNTPRSYAKLCALSVGYGWLLTFAASLLELAVVAGFLAFGVPADGASADQAQSLAVMAAVLVFITASHRKFWGMSWLRASLCTLAMAVLSWAVVYPGLGYLAGQLHVVDRLKDLLS